MPVRAMSLLEIMVSAVRFRAPSPRVLANWGFSFWTLAFHIDRRADLPTSCPRRVVLGWTWAALVVPHERPCRTDALEATTCRTRSAWS